VFVNLLLNAAQAIAPGDADANEVRVSTHLERPGWVSIEVRDTGDGIPEDALNHIFEPFFTTKSVGVGTGLGLSICHGIVKSLGGEMKVESRVGEGTLFRVLLRAAPREATAADPSVAEAPKAQRARVLVIDDEPMVLRAVKRMLSEHTVITSESAAEGLELITRGDRFDLVISDLMMPSMTGMDLFEELLKRSPDLARSMVFITGGATTLRSEAFLQSVTNDRLIKPFSAAALISLVNRRLESTHPKAGDTG
jgi:CheY-like chemotaxis protein